jgi:hypothetical protein
MRRVLTGALTVSMLLGTTAVAVAKDKNEKTCGGVDRWSIKTGTDSGALTISTAASTPTTISALRALPKPEKRPMTERADQNERTAWTISGFLVLYKVEPDQDYHLVVADAQNNRMVVEVPDPACIHGTSPFTEQIRVAREAVDALVSVHTKFPASEVKIPLRVTGIGFFDKPAHGTGAALNGIELHPVVRVEFNPSGTTTTAPLSGPTVTVTGPTQLLGDPGFENGSSSTWNASTDVITSSKKRDPHSGKTYAWLGGYGSAHTDTLSQQVSLPSSANRVTLSYWMAIDTAEKHSRGTFESTEAFDSLTLEIRGSGGRSDEVAQFSNVNAHAGYIQMLADLTPYKGQTVTLVFTAIEDQSLQTSFLLDDMTIDVQ